MAVRKKCWKFTFTISDSNTTYLNPYKTYYIDREEENDKSEILIEAAAKYYYDDFLKANVLSNPPEVNVLLRIEKVIVDYK